MEKALTEACAFVDAHFREPLSLGRIAGHAGYSVYHFHRAFRDRMGMTLGEYVLETRLAAARDLLLHSSSRIIDVALDVGFDCPETFARAFRRLYCVTPSEFRKLTGPGLKRARADFEWRRNQRSYTMPYEMVHLLSVAVDRRASDLTVAPGVPPYVCVNGSLDVVGGNEITPPEAQRMFESITSEEDQQCLRESGKADYAFWFENVARFRVSVVRSDAVNAPIMRLFMTDRDL
ncbi:MAG: helix-turn-helix domain-containing protein [Candidatus Hydrogenedentes bacterium]|nr:helix-turn-helix domain-containing protein [Candidatus Hydrogenedentota bacterium]